MLFAWQRRLLCLHWPVAMTPGAGLNGVLTSKVVEELRGIITLPFQTTCDRIRRRSRKPIKPLVNQKPEIRLHDLRDTYISWLAKNSDVLLTAIKCPLELCSLSVTTRYGHLQGNYFAVVSGLKDSERGTNVRVTH